VKRSDNGLFMHFYDSNHEVTQMQQEEKQQHQRAEINKTSSGFAASCMSKFPAWSSIPLQRFQLASII